MKPALDFLRRSGRAIVVAVNAGLLLGLAACTPAPSTTTATSATPSAARKQALDDELFGFAIDNLQRLEQFEPGAMVKQVVDRLNQWSAGQKPPAGWQPDPLVSTLPKPCEKLVRTEALESVEFTGADGAAMQEAVWARDVGQWVRGSAPSELIRAQRLFDWTVRNIQLPPGDAPAESFETLPKLPWQTLLLGRAGALDRAWLFLALARQQGIEAAMLGLPNQEKPWAIGVLIENEIYLFDHELGLPISASEGVRRSADGMLELSPLSWKRLSSEPKLLANMDLDEKSPYRIRLPEGAKLTVLLEATPISLSRRMKLVESRLAGKQKFILTANPSASAKRWRDTLGVADVRLWDHPFTTFVAQMQQGRQQIQQWAFATMPFQGGDNGGLWRARLTHLKGLLAGDEGATALYQALRPATKQLEQQQSMRAKGYYESSRKTNPSGSERAALAQALQRAQFETDMAVIAKQYASYWLGLVSYERGNFDTAVDYFQKRTIEAWPKGLWTIGASYNLARADEAAQRTDAAIKGYRGNDDAPDSYGQRLRAKWLGQAAKSPK